MESEDGTLIVEFADGPRKEFKAGQGFPQARSKWHRGRNDGKTPVRFLAVLFGGMDVPSVLNPPKSHKCGAFARNCKDVREMRPGLA